MVPCHTLTSVTRRLSVVQSRSEAKRIGLDERCARLIQMMNVDGEIGSTGDGDEVAVLRGVAAKPCCRQFGLLTNMRVIIVKVMCASAEWSEKKRQNKKQPHNALQHRLLPLRTKSVLPLLAGGGLPGDVRPAGSALSPRR